MNTLIFKIVIIFVFTGLTAQIVFEKQIKICDNHFYFDGDKARKNNPTKGNGNSILYLVKELHHTATVLKGTIALYL